MLASRHNLRLDQPNSTSLLAGTRPADGQARPQGGRASLCRHRADGGWHDGHQVNFGRVGAVVHQRCNADIEAINRGDQGAMSVGGCHVVIDSARDAEPGR